MGRDKEGSGAIECWIIEKAISRENMLKQRVLTSVVGIPILIAAIWFHGPWFTIVAAGWGFASVLEFYSILRKNKIPIITAFGALWTVLIIIYPYLASTFSGFFADHPLLETSHFIPLLLTAAVILPLVYKVLIRTGESAFPGWIWTIAGILYIGWLLSYFVALREFSSAELGTDFGRNWVYLALLATFASDTSAYFIGKTWGKHHLAPAISPKKTWEGSVAGVIGAIIVCLLFTLPTPLQLPLNYWQAVILGLLVSVFGQIGDLTESLFKRNMSVKDSSQLIPGHGGFLDRMDSVAFAGIVVYYYVVWVAGHL
jgi:phosphatidate cytidylyltransferase